MFLHSDPSSGSASPSTVLDPVSSSVALFPVGLLGLESPAVDGVDAGDFVLTLVDVGEGA